MEQVFSCRVSDGVISCPISGVSSGNHIITVEVSAWPESSGRVESRINYIELIP